MYLCLIATSLAEASLLNLLLSQAISTIPIWKQIKKANKRG
ncbi:hypothetical protein HMPREF1869_00425 [Bacteroidales bacterium KA00251]|nr:hypothetical protein HMPREF1869_00425 [Bacteroidales bacterium KA00251]